MVLSFDVPPVQLWHNVEPGEQVAPLAKLPVQQAHTKVSDRSRLWNERDDMPWGQIVPLGVEVGTGVHLVRFLVSCRINRSPVDKLRREEPVAGRRLEEPAVALGARSPVVRLHEPGITCAITVGAADAVQSAALRGGILHWGVQAPARPRDALVARRAPGLTALAHCTEMPWCASFARQTHEPRQARAVPHSRAHAAGTRARGGAADGWMATRGRDEMLLPKGSSRVSGTESQSTTRLSRVIQMLDESATDWVADSGFEREEFAKIGSGAKAGWPA
ncbi:hypothetical protein EYR38_002032 [Pleurotus pulmonarius]|nr:hypothetical protein EYR38_002032 [Pleurotus pulmonarius]